MHWSWCLLLGLGVACALSVPASGQECSETVIDAGGGAGITDVLDIVDDVSIETVSTYVDITHASIDELSIFLESPFGTLIGLYISGGAGGVEDLTVTFTDSGVDHGEGLFTCDCDMKPSGPGQFDDFAGQRSSGVWTLTLVDLIPDVNDATLNEWCLTITGCDLFAPVDLACVPDQEDSSVELSWLNEDPDLEYTGVVVFVNGEVHDTLAPDADSTTISDLDTGRYVFHVAAESADCTTPSEACTVAMGFAEICTEFVALDSDGSATSHEVLIPGPAGDDELTLTDVDVRLDMETFSVDSWTIDLVSPLGTTVTLHSIDDPTLGAFDLVWADDGILNAAPYDCDCRMEPTGPGAFADYVDEGSAGDWTFEITSIESGVLNEICIGFYGDTDTCDPILEPEDFACTFEDGGIALSWVNPQLYTRLFLEVISPRDPGVTTLELGAAADAFKVEQAAIGTFDFTLTAWTDDECPTASTSCSVTIFGEAAGVDAYEVATASLDFGPTGFDAIPTDFFDDGSVAFDGTIAFEGMQLGTAGPFELGTTDLLVQRLGSVLLEAAPSNGEVPTEMVALSLRSTEPLVVTLGDDDWAWDSVATLSPGTGIQGITRDTDTSGTISPEITGDLEVTFTNSQFIRADANMDSVLNLGDPIKILRVAFLDDLTSCLDACDADDDGDVDIIDFFAAADYIFLDGDEPPAPFPDPGEDPTDDDLDCTRERTLLLGEVTLTGLGDWNTDASCNGENLRVKLFPLGNCRDDFILTGSGLSLSLSSPDEDAGRPTATVDASATVDAEVGSLGRNAVIGAGVTIGADTVVGPGVTIGADAVIGDGVILGADSSVEAGATVSDGCIVAQDSSIGEDATLGAEVVLGERCEVADRSELGAGTSMGADSSIGDDAVIGADVRIGRTVTVGDDVLVDPDLVVADGADIAAGSTLTENLLLCTEDLGGGRFVGTVTECEDADGAVLGHLPQPRGVQGASEDSVDILDADALPLELASLSADVTTAGALDPDGAVIARSFVPGSHDADDFADALEQELDALGYDANLTLLWEYEDHPEHQWWNQRWVPANRPVSTHAVVSVLVATGVVFVEPQTGEVGVDWDGNGDGSATWTTTHGPPVATDGDLRLETYGNRTAAEGAGVELD